MIECIDFKSYFSKCCYCLFAASFFAIVFLPSAMLTAQEQKVIVVVGAPGSDEYQAKFETWADNWKSAIESTADPKPELAMIGRTASGKDRESLKAAIDSTNESVKELWIVLIGHGTDDRKTSKFNLSGPDVSASELNEWLTPLPCRVIVINCSSASGTFISKLKHKNRIVVTATKSGAQHNFARFGGFFSEAIADSAFDLDKDQQTSLLEAVLAASAQAQEFYMQDSRLATELAMVDDNGDGLGTPADWFEGTRVTKKPKSGLPDGFVSNQIFLVRGGMEAQLSPEQRLRRDELELKLEGLRLQKDKMTEDDYYLAIEPILVELSELYDEVAKADDPETTPEASAK